MKTIYTKLAELKKEVGKMTKDSKNPFFNSKYFDINQLLEHLEPLLQKNNLIVLQPILNKEVVSKIIEIETGDEICSSLELPALNDPQKIGSAITYYRRYTLQSLLGIQAEDDDANIASGKQTIKEPIPTKNEPEKWLNVDSEEWNALAKVVENGTTVTLAQVRKKYKVSKETQKALESLNIFLIMGANSEYFIQLQEQFLNDCDRYENGHISALDVAVKFKEEMSFLEHLSNQRKNWIDENLESVSNEADNYNNEYKGYKVTLQSRETLNFKSIPQWNVLENAKKEFEQKSKLAWQLVKKGGLNVDENGEEIPLPEVKVSSFIKMEKLK